MSLKQSFSYLSFQSLLASFLSSPSDTVEPVSDEVISKLQLENRQTKESIKQTKEQTRIIKQEIEEIIEKLSAAWKMYEDKLKAEQVKLPEVVKSSSEEDETQHSELQAKLALALSQYALSLSFIEDRLSNLERKYELMHQQSKENDALSRKLDRLLQKKKEWEDLLQITVKSSENGLILGIDVEGETINAKVVFNEAFTAFVEIQVFNSIKKDIVEEIVAHAIETQQISFFIREIRAIYIQ